MNQENVIKTITRRLGKLSKFSWRERGLLLESFFLLGIGRFLVIMVPFRRVAPHLGEINGSHPLIFQETDQEHVQQIARWVRFSSRFTPFTSNCFNKALAAHFMLRRRGLSSTLYLGVAKEGQNMEAHAWLISGEQIITGADVHERFTEVSHFTWTPKETLLE